MSRQPRCDQLRAEANSNSWSRILVLYCRKAIIENSQMAQQLNALHARLVGIGWERAALLKSFKLLETVMLRGRLLT